MRPTKRGLRLGPFSSTIDEEVETLSLKFLHQVPQFASFFDCIERFNVNVPYSGIINAVTQDVSQFAFALNSFEDFYYFFFVIFIAHQGLFAENKEKLIIQAISALKDFEDEQLTNEQLEQELNAFRRLVASKTGYNSFTGLSK
jgi:hypothetical protein